MESHTVHEGRVFERAGGLAVPSRQEFAGKTLVDSVPKTRVKITIEVWGGALPEGQKVMIRTADILLKGPEQLVLEYFDPEDDKLSDESWRGEHWDRRVRLELKLSEPDPQNDIIYEVEYPVAEGKTLTVDQDGRS